MSDQLLLFEDSWREFFILAVAENLVPINFTHLMFAYELLNNNRDKTNLTETIIREVEVFQDVLNKLVQFRIDSNEYIYLRAIVLYKTDFDGETSISSTSSEGSDITGPSKMLHEIATIRALEENAKEALATYIANYQPNQPGRYKNLLLMLPSLRSVSNFTIEELFFRRNIGHLSIGKLLIDLYTQRKI